jgi:Flp pilus assembly pilin Flp
MDRLYTAIGVRLAVALGALSAPSFKREEGQTLVEYALIIGLIAIGLTAALIFLRGKIGDMFSSIATNL